MSINMCHPEFLKSHVKGQLSATDCRPPIFCPDGYFTVKIQDDSCLGGDNKIYAGYFCIILLTPLAINFSILLGVILLETPPCQTI